MYPVQPVNVGMESGVRLEPPLALAGAASIVSDDPSIMTRLRTSTPGMSRRARPRDLVPVRPRGLLPACVLMLVSAVICLPFFV